MVKRTKFKDSGEATNQKNFLQNRTLSLACQDNEEAFRSGRHLLSPFHSYRRAIGRADKQAFRSQSAAGRYLF